ncbi:MAG: hypothetical protein ACI4RD_03490 [Kiritimatiellia bacterium]
MKAINTQAMRLAVGAAAAWSAVTAAAIDKVAVRQVADGEQAVEATAFGAPSDTGYLIQRGGGGGILCPPTGCLTMRRAK